MKFASVILVLALMLIAVPAFAQTAQENLDDVYQNTEAFDGGPGSTINTEPVNESPVGEVPDVGESGPVEY